MSDSVQAVVDLLIPGRSPGIKEQIVDLYGKPEMLFFGPDGTFSIVEKLTDALIHGIIQRAPQI